MTRPFFLLALAVSLACFPSCGVAADLHGRIIVTKSITKKRVTLPVYQLRGVSSITAPESAGPVSEYREIVIFLEGAFPATDQPIQAELQQRNRRFEPQILMVPVGSTVTLPNADPVFHNVFSLSNAKKFDLGYYPAGQTRIVKFDEPGIVQVYCHLHPNMYAAIVVAPNRWRTRPEDDGTFSLSGIPPGKHRLVAWHMSAGFFRKELQVPEHGDVDVVIRIPVRDEELIR